MARSPKTTLLPILLCAVFVFGSLSVSAKLTKKLDQKQCSRTALQLKNCYLEFDRYSVRIWKQKLSVSDKVNRDLVDLPMTGEKVEWVTGRMEKLNDTYFIEWVAWEEPSATNEIQTKMWYVYRLKAEKAELVLSRPLVKRIKVDNGKPKSDNEIQFGLRLEKKTPIWFAGKDKGDLK